MSYRFVAIIGFTVKTVTIALNACLTTAALMSSIGRLIFKRGLKEFFSYHKIDNLFKSKLLQNEPCVGATK